MHRLAEADRQPVRDEMAAERAAEERSRCPACRERAKRFRQLIAEGGRVYDTMTACGCTAGRS
jgi:hypothetical protein